MKLTNMTASSLSALTIIDGVNHRKAYINSPSGRPVMEAECAEAENFDEALAIWGPEPTVPEYEPAPDVPSGPSLADRVAALEKANDDLAIALLEGA